MKWYHWLGVVAAALVVIFMGISAVGSLGNDGPKLTSAQERALRATGMERDSMGPKVKEALELVEAINDLHVSNEIKNGAIAQHISCTAAARSAFDAENGTPRYRMYRWESGRIECFRSGNFHPVTGAPLMPLTKDHVGAILDPKNSQLYPAEQGGLWDLPQTRPVATPAPKPAAVPDLSEGPCCSQGR